MLGNHLLYIHAVLLIFKTDYIDKGVNMGLGKIEIALLIVLVIILLFVGAKKLPELARGIGQSAKELKKGFKEDVEEDVPAKKTAKKTTKK